MNENDLPFLRRAIELAHTARRQGHDPFGAVLVAEGRIVHEALDRSVACSDPTYHAELSVISEYCRGQHVFMLSDCTLYAVLQHRAMRHVRRRHPLERHCAGRL